MKKFMRIPYEQDSGYSYEELRANISSIMKEQRELSLYKLKGSPVYLLEKEKEKGQFCLKYHHAYKKDMCDTCVRFYIEKGLEKCTAKGFICKPAGSWAVFWGVIATLIIDFLIITYCLLFTADFDMAKALMISGVATIVRAYVCMSVMQFNRYRLEEIKLKMMEILGAQPAEETERTEENERN